MEHHTKPTGEKFVFGDRVRTFSALRLSTPKSFFTPNFAMKEEEETLL